MCILCQSLEFPFIQCVRWSLLPSLVQITLFSVESTWCTKSHLQLHPDLGPGMVPGQLALLPVLLLYFTLGSVSSHADTNLLSALASEAAKANFPKPWNLWWDVPRSLRLTVLSASPQHRSSACLGGVLTCLASRIRNLLFCTSFYPKLVF